MIPLTIIFTDPPFGDNINYSDFNSLGAMARSAYTKHQKRPSIINTQEKGSTRISRADD